MIGVLAGVIIAGVFLSIAYQLLTGFGVEQQKKQAMTVLNELASGINYACGAGEGSSFSVPLRIPLIVSGIRTTNNKVCVTLDSEHCIPVKCRARMDPVDLNTSFYRTKARISKTNTVDLEFTITRGTDFVSIESTH